jgi:hypothetical protein
LTPLASSFLLGALLAWQTPEHAATPVALVRTARVGESVVHRFRQTLELRLVEYESWVVADGKASEPQKGPPVELVRDQEEEVVFRDEVLEVEDGRATHLRRHFERIESLLVQTVRRAGAAAQSSREVGESPLADRSVLFRFDPELARYAADFAEEASDAGERDRAGEARLLAPLEARADLSWFLPPGPVEPGARWSIEPKTFVLLSSPSGELSLRIDGREEPRELGRLFHEHLEGSIEARFDGLRSSEQGEAAVIHVSAALDTEFELGAEPDARAPGDRYRFHFVLEGDLEWDQATGRARGIELAGPATLWLETRRRLEDFDLLTRQRLDGRMRFRVELR